MTVLRIVPANRQQDGRSAESGDSTRAGAGRRVKGRTNRRIPVLKPRSSAQDLVDQFRTLIEDVRWQRADALILALQDDPLKSTLWAVIGAVLAGVPAAKGAANGADGRAAS